MSTTIGIVTGGGDCPGLNAVIRAVVKAAAKRGWETIGIIGGYEGLLPPQQVRPLDYQSLGGLLTAAERFSAPQTADGSLPKSATERKRPPHRASPKRSADSTCWGSRRWSSAATGR
jgi:hypothetical protein